MLCATLHQLFILHFSGQELLQLFCGMVHPRTIDCIVNRGRLVYATKAWVKSFNIEFRAEDSDSQFSESADTHSCIEGYMLSLVKSV